MSTVSENVVNESGGSHLNSILGMGVQPVHLKLALDHFGYVVAISSGISSRTVDVWHEVVDLLTALITDD